MKLSGAERWILRNQYEILKLLDPDRSGAYDRAIEVLDCGYEGEYSGVCPYAAEQRPLSDDDCDEVRRILHMFLCIEESIRALSDPSRLTDRQLRFRGFDGNNETREWGYATRLLKSGQFDGLPGGPSFNSHAPCLPRYRAMLETYRSLGSPMLLSEDNLRALAESYSATQ